MPSTLKTELGLGDPSARDTTQGSTEQADKFKAAFQAAAAQINECLQYTAAHAEQTKHDPQAAKRDTSCQAYQVALQRIDPKNPAAAQGSIDQVLAGVESLKSAVTTLKTAVEKAFSEWNGKQGTLESVTDKIREMVEWGHGKAGALQQVVDAIVTKANNRAYDEASKALDQLQGKADPVYQDYQNQKAAQDQYDPARQGLQSKLDETKNCPFKSLAADQQAIEGCVAPMEQSATEKKYVDALPKLKEIESKIDEFKAKVTALQEKKAAYETARGPLESKLAEASKCQYKSLAEMDQHIADLTTKTETAATDEKYDEAVTGVGELVVKVDEKLQKVKELDEKKSQYEEARKTLDPKLGEASKCQFKSLAELDQKIADLTTKAETAATDEKYDDAVASVGELSTAVDDKVKKADELTKKKDEYDKVLGEITPRMPNQCEADYPSLEPLQTELTTLNDQMVKAAEAEDYENAVKLAGDLKTKLDAYEKAREDLVKKKDEYDKARAALNPKLAQASTCKHESLAKLDEEIAKMTGELDNTAGAKDWAKAVEMVGQLSAKCDTKLSEEARLDRKIIGDAQKERADKKYEGLDEDGKKRFNKLVEGAKTPEERDYIMKSLAANYSMDDIEAFAKKINGKDKDWLQNNLKLTGNTDGKGVKQQWSYSCNATTTQALRGELDPVYALKLHEENKDITKADNADATKENPKLAEEQKKWLESQYSGSASSAHKGVATSRDDPTGTGSGRWADDLMNNMSDVTGVEYSNQKIGTSYKVDDAVKDIDSGLKKGNPVPIVIGNSSTSYTHYVLVTGRDDGPPATFTIHDPWDGVTVKRTVQDVKDGKINLANSNQISALEKPKKKD